MELADKKACTGCGVCAYVCPKQCISFNVDGTYGISYPVIDHSLCVECGRCRLSCPALDPLENGALRPLKAYAAWSTDAEERRTSASGGIGAEIYKYAIKKGWAIVGAAFQEGFEVGLKLSDHIEAIKEFKNSKYVFCSTGSVYKDIDKRLRAGDKIAVIALPCQIAAIKKIFHKHIDNLLLVDLVCHGTMPSHYLKQYIRYMGAKYNKDVKSITFRDPGVGTQNFALSLFDMNDRCFYSSVKLEDPYQFAYHRIVAYRENCYHCLYANCKRLGDMTIGDYHGLGQSVSYLFSTEKVSCILVNTPKGYDYISSMANEKKIVIESRPIEEPINGDSQLRHPSLKTYSRRLFEKKYNGDFVGSIHSVYAKTRFRESFIQVCRLPYSLLKRLMNRL